jgi:glycine cleavage system aminomethyltransferase T
VTLDFLSPGTGADAPPAEGPMAAVVARDGASFVVRDGWRVPVRFAGSSAEGRAVENSVGWGDVSHRRKVELQGAPDRIGALAGGLASGRAVALDGAWHCRLTPTRALVIGGSGGDRGASLHAVDVTTQFAAVSLVGPAARETLARFCALDLRPAVTPPGSVRPGSVARTPGLVVCEAPDRFLVLVGAAFGEYLWSVVSNAGAKLGGRPVGADVLERIERGRDEVESHA